MLLSTAGVTRGQAAQSQPNSPVVQFSEEAVAPRRIHYVAPEYPPMARSSKIEGIVTLRGQIATDGTMIGLQTLSGQLLLIREALNAVKQWRYEPMVLHGQPAEILTTISVVFALRDNPSGAAKPTTPLNPIHRRPKSST
jgi:TonB family protein